MREIFENVDLEILAHCADGYGFEEVANLTGASLLYVVGTALRGLAAGFLTGDSETVDTVAADFWSLAWGRSALEVGGCLGCSESTARRRMHALGVPTAYALFRERIARVMQG